ncbi:MAG: DUF3592 domain-containing protein [Candidatus Kariarchaeaceae archaeon]|jgi:hypothetical protein
MSQWLFGSSTSITSLLKKYSKLKLHRIVFLIVILILAIFLSIHVPETQIAIESENWDTTEGQIKKSWYIENTDESSSSAYQIYVEYEYSVGETTYQSDDIIVGGKPVGRSSLIDTQEYLEEHRVGANTTVYYNPDNHKQSALEPGLSEVHIEYIRNDLFIFLFGTLILALGKVGFIYQNPKKKIKSDYITCKNCGSSSYIESVSCNNCGDQLKVKPPKFIFENIAISIFLPLGLILFIGSAVVGIIFFWFGSQEILYPSDTTFGSRGVAILMGILMLGGSGVVWLLSWLLYKLNRKIWKALWWDFEI